MYNLFYFVVPFIYYFFTHFALQYRNLKIITILLELEEWPYWWLGYWWRLCYCFLYKQKMADHNFFYG